ncbi:unnamed protein product [Heligmosomoides polygyrus]|uniref:guanylate cyclase n=1 Tax=Heligmosomoides polygyrus TaxID=6339 RepID=A0A3P8EJH4_HELPZ|nr:unnamed protein product [Heligmosomoides polygyrus]
MSDELNNKRRVDQNWIKQNSAVGLTKQKGKQNIHAALQSIERRRAADIYSFGMVMYEILFRSFPYNDKMDIHEMSTKARLGEKISRPSVQKDKQLHPDLQALLQDCWHDSADARPSVRRVRLSTDAILKTKGSLVDSMTRMMEEYANNLEKLVSDRTGMLEQATVRADKLLSQLLPKFVANELKNGRPVPPKMYTSATVLFTDVVGFTKLCGTSTPLEVVNLLNSVYSGFDEIINKHDGYKVRNISMKICNLIKYLPMHIAFLDLNTAFDRLLREVIRYALRDHDVPEELIEWVRILYSCPRSRVKTAAGTSIEFPISIGGQQVETIGDAYMVVSGIPEENGRRHISNIAEIALDIMEFLDAYRIPHRKSEQLVIRIGFHSGPVAAAVVGLNAPRYCLFGDTVSGAKFGLPHGS